LRLESFVVANFGAAQLAVCPNLPFKMNDPATSDRVTVHKLGSSLVEMRLTELLG